MLKNKFLSPKINNPPLIVEVLRGNTLESQHRIHIVIMDGDGKVFKNFGDPEYLTFPRSAIKPLQALAFAESGALEKFGLTARHLALACASHRGESQHTELAMEWLNRLSLSMNNFCCGAHNPGHVPTYEVMIRKGERPTPLHNNCSGKHLGILSTCLSYGWDPIGYHHHDHPFQKLLRQILSEIMDVDHDMAPWGIDGCGIPSYAVPLQNLTKGMTGFLNPKGSWKDFSANSLEKIKSAMLQFPELVAGTDELVSVFMKKANGKILLKNGAEGVFAGVILSSAHGAPLAFAMKCEDGAGRGAHIAAAEFLNAAQVFTESESSLLRDFLRPVIKNWAGESVGSYRIQ